MRVKFNTREVEITDYDIGPHWDEAFVVSANYTDGDCEELTEDELDTLSNECQDLIIQEAREFASDYYCDMER